MILLLGSSGQLGTSIALELSKSKYDFFAADYKTLDIANYEQVNEYISFLKPKAIINAAAYTNVQKAEEEKKVADKINNISIQNIVRSCESNFTKDKLPVIFHYSTDYVFDGNNTSHGSYKESDNTNPLNYYGISKRNGELALTNGYERFFIMRTSWLFSPHGHNFIKTIANKLLDSSTSSPLTVVNDQFGSPTSALSLAKATNIILQKIFNDKDSTSLEKVLETMKQECRYGIYHFSGDVNRKTSWFDFAQVIRTYCALHKNSNELRAIDPCPSDAFIMAKRPANSLMDCTKIKTWLNLDKKYFNWEADCKKIVDSIVN
jgi:dTDP-4-dehydrorhamnose reductase